LLPFSPEPSSSAVKNLKIRIYKTIILPVVLYVYETWSLILREECRPKVFEKRVLKRIFGPKRDEVMDGFENCISRSFVMYTLRQVRIIRMVKSRRMR
jgi:hypothetical protein